MFLIFAKLTYLNFRPPFWRGVYYITSHGTAQFYSVSTFTGKNHLKLIHNDMKGVSARAYSTNYFQRLTLESWYTNLQQTPLNRCQPRIRGGGGGGKGNFHMEQTGMLVVLLRGVNFGFWSRFQVICDVIARAWGKKF